MKVKTIFSKKRILPVLIVVFLLTICLSSMTPLIADDYTYSFSWSSNQRNDSIAEIIRSMKLHWDLWHGRVIANGLASYYLMVPKVFFNIVNALNAVSITLALAYIFNSHSDETVDYILPLIIALMLIWNFMPAFGQVFLWVDGSCNYSWGVGFTLLFLAPFFSEYFGKRAVPSAPARILMVLISFIAGAYYESGAISALFISLCIMIILLIKNRRLIADLSINFIAALGGFIWMMSAPSMHLGHRGSFSIKAVIDVFRKLFDVLDNLFYIAGTELTLIILIALILIIAFLIIIRKKRKLCYAVLFAVLTAGTATALVLAYILIPGSRPSGNVLDLLRYAVSSPVLSLVCVCFIFFILLLNALYLRVNRSTIILCLVLFLGGVGSIAAFLFANYFPARGTVYFVFYTTIASGLLTSELSLHQEKKSIRTLTAVLSVIFAISFVMGCSDIFHVHSQAVERKNTIDYALDNGLTEIQLEAFDPKTKYSGAYGLEDVIDDPENGWINTQICRYYGLGKVYLKK